jgi:hypothetical protein
MDQRNFRGVRLRLSAVYNSARCVKRMSSSPEPHQTNHCVRTSEANMESSHGEVKMRMDAAACSTCQHHQHRDATRPDEPSRR